MLCSKPEQGLGIDNSTNSGSKLHARKGDHDSAELKMLANK